MKTTKKDQDLLTTVNSQESPIYVNIDEDMQETSNEVQETESRKDLTRSEIIKEMKSKIGHKAKVVPFNSIQWIDGIIVGILDDIRSKSPLWTVKDLKTGKLVRKAYGSDLIQILDEKVDNFSLKQKSVSPRTEKEVEDLLRKAWSYVGRYTEVLDKKMLIKTVVLDKRTNTVLLKLSSPETGKQFYKTLSNIGKILDETDLETVEYAKKRLEQLTEDDNPDKKRQKLEKKMNELNAKIIEFRNEVAKIQQELSELDQMLETDKTGTEMLEPVDETEDLE